MNDQANPRLFPTAHLPNLFQRTLKTASAKGGLAFGEPSQLLPWLSTTTRARETGHQKPAVTVGNTIHQESPELAAPGWLHLSVARDDTNDMNSGLVFKLRPISHVGFGFGYQRPW